MDVFPITIVFGSLILLLVTLLAMNTTRVRARTPRDASPEQREALRRAMRTHGNNFEHGVPVILLMLFYEAGAGQPAVLCSIGSVFLLIRLIYSYGYLTRPGGTAQVIGAGLTYLTELVLVGLVLASVYVSVTLTI